MNGGHGHELFIMENVVAIRHCVRGEFSQNYFKIFSFLLRFTILCLQSFVVYLY